MIDYRTDKCWTVYIHISPSNKYYVGITSQKPKYRWNNGEGYKYNVYFYRAVQKYGWNNIQHEIIAEHLTHDEACDMEKTLIKKLQANDRMYGYNLTDGGQGISGMKRSPETIEKIRQANIGKTFSPEVIEKIRRGNLGKKLSEETLAKRSAYFKNTPDEELGNTVTVYQFTKEGVFVDLFYSVKTASEFTGIHKSNISHAAINNLSAGGYLWVREDNVVKDGDTYHIKNFKYNKSRTSGGKVEVYQFDKNTHKFICKYDSYAEASRKTGETTELIRDDVRYKRINDSEKKKYRWRNKEDVEESRENPGSFIMLR